MNKRLQVSGFYSDNGQISSFFINKTYSYGATGQDNGNVTSIINNKDATRTQTYTYDSLNRITAGWSAAGSGTLSWGENYTIDAWGNLMMSPMSGKAHGGTFQHAGDANNHASGLGYDAAGNLTNYSAPNQYVYDPENRIQSTAGTTYTYDSDGNRVKKSSGSTGTLYWYGLPGIIAESDLSGILKSEYIFVNGKRAARIDLANNSVHYYLSDHLNSTSMVISSAGVVEDEADYSAFGTEYPVTSSGGNHYKFTGKERDSESGLDYFGARYYSNAFGRFLTPDWAEKATAVPYAIFSDPQSLNLYSYVRNVPSTGYDPDGHFNDPFNTFGGDGLFDDSDGESNIESSHSHMTRVTTTTTKTTVRLPSLDGTTPGPTITNTQEDVTVTQVGVAGSLHGKFIPRHLTDYEKQQLGPYVSEKDLNNAIIHVGQTPKDGILPFPFPSDASAVTVHNNIYIRRQYYDPETSDFLGHLLSHELYHVFQYRTGVMTPFSYLREAARHGSGVDNKFEAPAYDFGDWVFEQLVNTPL